MTRLEWLGNGAGGASRPPPGARLIMTLFEPLKSKRAS
jgi:hypothetical protein